LSVDIAVFERTIVAGWGDMDFNSHMRNTAYLDKAVDVRMMFFAAHGFPVSEFARLRVGPVVMKDEVEYYRETNLLDELRVTLAIAGLAEDGSRFRLRNEFFGADGRRVARLSSSGGWLDLAARRLVAAPPAMLETLSLLERTDDFAAMPSSVRAQEP
jgi:acyl-CoA thioester hydrolase